MKPKFRAWDSHEKKMFTNAQLIIWNGNVYANDNFKLNVDNLKGWNIDEKYIMQSTGLFDKNGNEIFEGDIVRYKLEEKTFTDIVSFHKFFACFGLEDDTGDWFCSFDWLLENIKQDDIEAVGNVYENQEFLEVK